MAGQLWDRVLLGLIQGLTEFLPVSSSGHLVLARKLLHSSEIPFLSDVFTHLATVLAVITVYRKEIWDIVVCVKNDCSTIWRNQNSDRKQSLSPEGRLILYIVIGTIPAAVAGLLFEERITDFFTQPHYVGIFLLCTGAVLISTHWKPYPMKQLSAAKALIIGCAQMAGLLPGISRSGATISAGLWIAIKPEEAVKFSFFLAIPVVIGANLLEFSLYSASISLNDLGYIFVSGITAYISGIIAIKVLIKIVTIGKFFLFGIYCIVIGTLTVLFM